MPRYPKGDGSGPEQIYPLGDRLNTLEREFWNLTIEEASQMVCLWATPNPARPQWIGAQATREYRAPRKGEWYLSGAEVTAYRANGYSNMAYHIARLCMVKTTVVRTVQFTPDEYAKTGS